MYKTVSIICSISLIITYCSCSNLLNQSNSEWDLPEKPLMKLVSIDPIKYAIVEKNGFYIKHDEAENLAYNIEELKAYIEKLEALIKKMQNHK